MGNQKTVLVTGISSGIGRTTADLLAQQGFQVFGTARTPSSGRFPPHIRVLELDVRDEQSVHRCVSEVLEKAGCIDALVNNAGIAVIGAIEESTLRQAHDIFETNFFGVVRMTQAVLPAMRAQRHGRIVNLSSVVGFLPAPFMGFYAASKHALEGYTESLDHEVRPFGIRAVLIEPGFTRTNIGQNAQRPDHPLDAYRGSSQRMVEGIGRHVRSGDDPAIVARAIQDALESAAPQVRYRVGREAVRLSRLRRFMPARLFDQGLRKQFQLDEAAGRHSHGA